ncbi:energy transducer TonB [Ferrimonas senticii]|uniref:energy transducer TonB n=1 Tax=Ferrimonas senticii TaxID=394566 RepID=UPI0003F79C71|nr:energy transducer TonB [Ferrimonas senticii]
MMIATFGRGTLRLAVALPLAYLLVFWLPQQLNHRGPVQLASTESVAPLVLPPPPPPKQDKPKPQQQNASAKPQQALPKPAPAPSLNAPSMALPLLSPTLSMPSLSDAPLPELGQQLASLSEVDQPPKLLKYLPPKMPMKARNAGVTGKVMLRLVVSEQGEVVEATVQQAEPAGYFEQAALDAAKRWQFKPALIAQQAVAVFVDVPINFELN